MNKKGAFMGISGTWIAVLLVVGVIGGYLYMNPDALSGFTTPQTASVVSPAQQVITDCPATTTPEMKLVVLDRINNGTMRTDAFDVNVLLNGVQNGSYHLSSDTTADASPGDGYALYATQSGGNTTYFGDIITGNVKCQELEAINFYAATVGSLKLIAKNSDDGLSNGGGDRQPIGTGETVSMEFELSESTADACLGTYRSNKDLVLCTDYNAVTLKQPVVKMSGASLPVVGAPTGHASLVNTLNQNATTVCFTLTGVKEICDYDKVTGLSIQLEAQAAQNPNNGAGASDINMHLYMPQVWQDGGTGEWDFFYSDEYNGTQIITPKTAHIWIE